MGLVIICLLLWGFISVLIYFRRVREFQAAYFSINPPINRSRPMSGIDFSFEALLILLSSSRAKNKNDQYFAYARQAVRWLFIEIITSLLLAALLIYMSYFDKFN
jgi:hypothetical protein